MPARGETRLRRSRPSRGPQALADPRNVLKATLARTRPRAREGRCYPRAPVPDSFDLTQLQGLTEEEAARRLATEGLNDLARRTERSFLRIALGSGAPADVPDAGGRRRALPGHGRAARRADAARLRGGGDGHHHRPGAAHRARPGRAARPVEPARAGDPRRGAAAHRRRRGGARRRHRARRRRPRAGRRALAPGHQPLGRRVAAHRRVGAGAQDPRARRGRPRQAGRRRPALAVLGHAGDRRPGHRRSARHRRQDRAGEDRHRAAVARARGHSAAERDRPAGAHPGHRGPGGLRCGGGHLRG